MPLPRIAYIEDKRNGGYSFDIRNGIAAHRRLHAPWDIRFVAPEHLRTDSEWGFDGIIANILSAARVARAIQRAGLPTVDITPHRDAAIDRFRFPHVLPDDFAVGRAAGDYFLTRGFRNFAYVGPGDCNFSEMRRDGFKRAAGDAGYSVHVRNKSDDWWNPRARDGQLCRWLLDLPRPSAILAAADLIAATVLAACAEINLRVPEDIAVMGADGGLATCEMLKPTLSSIPLDAHGAGYAAAELLSRLMAGERPPAEPILIPPLPPVTRQSSDIMCTRDEQVAQALKFIAGRARDPISVSDVVEHCLVSRCGLEIRFRKAMGRTIGQEIMRVHLDRARELLRDTDSSVLQISEACGFSSQHRFSAVFHQKTGETPTEYRRRYQRR